MAAPDTASEFRTTHWSLILRARASRDDLNRLLREYWNPIYGYVRHFGFSRADADDLAQQFIHDVVIDRDLVGRADPQRGRFRAFVRTALRRFLIDRIRQNGHARTMPPEALQAIESVEDDSATREFDSHWASRVLEIAMQRLEDDCRKSGMEAQWMVFESRIVRPAIDGTEPAKIEELQRQLGLSDPQKVYSMLQTMKRKADSVIREVVAETVEDDGEIDAEYGDLRRLLA